MLARFVSPNSLLGAVIVALLCAMPTVADACDVAIKPITSTVRLDYDPFAFAPTTGELTIELENREAAACDVDLVLLNTAQLVVDTAEIDGTGVVTTITSSDPSLTPTPSAGIWRARLNANDRVRLALDVRVTHDVIASAGEHVADLSMEVRDAGMISTREPPVPLHVVLVALPRAQMNIAGAAGTFGQGGSVAIIDFGVLTGTITRRTFLQVRSNTRARLTIESANHGNLLRANASTPETGIAYTAEFNGQPVDLAKHWEQEVVAIPTIAGSSLPLDFRVAVDSAHVAGFYQDILTIELSAL